MHTLDATEAYIELLKKVLIGRVYSTNVEYYPLQARIGTWSSVFFEPIAKLLARRSLYLYRSKRITEDMWTYGKSYWPSQGRDLLWLAESAWTMSNSLSRLFFGKGYMGISSRRASGVVVYVC
jgi:hypothetical protein